MKLSSYRRLSGQGFVLILIVLGIIGAGLWYLYSSKAAADSDARRFGHDAIKRLAVDHDRSLLENDLAPDVKLRNPPSAREYIIQQFANLGVPEQPIQIEDNITFDSYFFSPHGFFTAHLHYPARPMVLQMAISHPQTKWQIDDITGPAPEGGAPPR
jgi:hypothetical protein